MARFPKKGAKLQVRALAGLAPWKFVTSHERVHTSRRTYRHLRHHLQRSVNQRKGRCQLLKTETEETSTLRARTGVGSYWKHLVPSQTPGGKATTGRPRADDTKDTFSEPLPSCTAGAFCVNGEETGNSLLEPSQVWIPTDQLCAVECHAVGKSP